MLKVNFKPFPLLETERMKLRRITLQDVAEIFILRSNNLILRYLDKTPDKKIEETVDQIIRMEKMISDNEGIVWGMSLKNAPDHIIGSICLWKFQKEHYRCELGYVIHPDHWRKGYAKEAISKVVSFGFDQLQLHSIEAQINPGNIASLKVLESSGFQREAYFKENYFFEGRFLDTAVYSILSGN